MTKPSKARLEGPVPKASSAAGQSVRDGKTGRLVTVRGVAALKGSGFKLDERIDLLKPIAEQVLARQREAR